jgi:D-3-phosphoglycerate dehydrogenase / 2-oxoglutarate reductase
LCSALGATAVLGTSRTARPMRPIDQVSLHELCTRADSVFLAAGLNEASRGMFRGEHIVVLPTDAVVVNIARPQLMDPASTRTALLDRRDVRVLVDGNRSLLDEQDWASLYELDNVEWTPHVAFNTFGALERCTAQAAAAVAAYCRSEPLDGYLATAPQRSG